MIMYDKSNDLPTNLSLTFDFGKEFSHFDYHSLALNGNETNLLLIGNQQIQYLHLETFLTSIINTIEEDNSTLISCSARMETIPLSDICHINRPIVQWNCQNMNEYALAVDRVVRFYQIDQSRIQEKNSIIDTQHQRPISTIAYKPQDSNSILTGSFDGQVQVWDLRDLSSKTPASVQFNISTPFHIRHIQWPATKSEQTHDVNQLAIQCDRCVRIYDMRRPDSYICSIEHAQRILTMDWTMQNPSIVTLSTDNLLRIFSTNGNLLAQSISNEQIPFNLSKIRTTQYDGLFICSSRDTNSSTFGFTSWRWDEDQFLRPLTDRIFSTCPSAIHDWTFMTNPKFVNLFKQILPTRSNNDLIKHFPILTWCRDNQLRLIDMDTVFRQTWQNYRRTKSRNSLLDQSKSFSSSSFSRQQYQRTNSNRIIMDIIEDELADPNESDDLDDSQLGEIISSPRIPSRTLSETSDENDLPISRIYQRSIDISIPNEFNSLQETYGPYITIEMKDEQRRVCILRCIYPLDPTNSFRIYVFLSRHYPIISQINLRFKFFSFNSDEYFKSFQIRIQFIFNETSAKCFYLGQLCLHKCLIKIKSFFESYSKQENLLVYLRKFSIDKRQSDESMNNSEFDSPNDLSISQQPSNKNSNRSFELSFSSARPNENPLSNCPIIRAKQRTCGARFASGTYLICFGRMSNSHQTPQSAPPIMNTLNDGLIGRTVPPFHMRSISLTVTKSRGNSSTDEQSSSYRSSTTITNNVQIQNLSLNQRTTMFSAPVRSSFGPSLSVDPQRVSTSSTSIRRSFKHHSPTAHSTVSLYDLSILLPVNKKLANDYKVELNHLIKMCEMNQQITEKMGKYELAHCWRLFAGLLTLQSTLSNDHSWFQTPIAQGLIKHIVSHHISDGDIQSASMFLLTMLKTPYMNKRKSFNEYHYDPILYSYANLLHRWKLFYKRTQILQEIDSNYQTSNAIPSSTSNVICSICLQLVVGQYFLCSLCGHGGHLNHMHGWFSAVETKHRYCPEKDCTCRCLIKQQEVLTTNQSDQMQKHQHTPTLTPRTYLTRPSSVGIRQL